MGIREIEPVQGFTKQFFETAFDKMNDSFEKPIFKDFNATSNMSCWITSQLRQAKGMCRGERYVSPEIVYIHTHMHSL